MDLPVIVFVILLLAAALLFTVIIRRDVKAKAAFRDELRRQARSPHIRAFRADLSPPRPSRVDLHDDTR